MSEPSRTPTEQKLYDQVRDAEKRLTAARARRDTYIRTKGQADHTVSDLARIFGMSRVALYKILRRGEGSAAPKQPPDVGRLNQIERRWGGNR